jgi:FlaA1/EpsC-like NDP-sugar epimerase
MGASKRIAELICQSLAQISKFTIFSIVRFGNVLGSSGSVSPRFKAQIENGGPVTVTHKDITRYFMTISEAAQLVIQAAAMGKGGDVFVLDMGKPIKIIDFAVSMIKSLGLKPHIADSLDTISKNEEDISIIITGLRKGEKLYEELLIGNKPFVTQHPRIMMARELSLPMSELQLILNKLKNACDNYDIPIILNTLKELPLDYIPTDQKINDVS